LIDLSINLPDRFRDGPKLNLELFLKHYLLYFRLKLGETRIF